MFAKKNSKLFTVHLKTLEKIERLLGKAASSERATTGINRRDKKTKIQQRGDMNNTKLNELQFAEVWE